MYVHIAPGDTCALIVWSDPEDDGCTPVTAYSVQVGEADAELVSPLLHCYLARDLVNATPYEVHVFAINAAGMSDDGTPTGEVTPAPPTLHSVRVVPDTVIGGEPATFIVELEGIPSPDGTTVSIGTEDEYVAEPQLYTDVTQCGAARLEIPVVTYPVTSDVGIDLIAELDVTMTAELTVLAEGSTAAPPCQVRFTSPADGAEITDFGTPIEGIIDCDTAQDWELRLCPAWTPEDSDDGCIIQRRKVDMPERKSDARLEGDDIFAEIERLLGSQWRTDVFPVVVWWAIEASALSAARRE